MILKKTLALSFVMFFIIMIGASFVIASCDDSTDSSIFLELNEEEQENFIVLLEYSSSYREDFTCRQSDNVTIVGYRSKSYLRPHLNLILQPPKQHFC